MGVENFGLAGSWMLSPRAARMLLIRKALFTALRLAKVKSAIFLVGLVKVSCL